MTAKGLSKVLALYFGFALSIPLFAQNPPIPPFPPTKKVPVTDHYHGITIQDNYLWLDTLNRPDVRDWVKAQNAYTHALLDSVPYRSTLHETIKNLLEGESSHYFGLNDRKQLFAMKKQPPKEQPFLVLLKSPDDTSGERILVDPNTLNSKGTTAIDWYVPSHDGRFVAVTLSENGSEDGSVHLFDVPTGRKLEDVVPRVQYPTASGDLEWNADATGFYYTRYPQGKERPPQDANFYQQVYFHTIGTPAAQDRYVIGKEFPRIAECRITSTEDGKYILVSVANGDGGEFEHFLLNPKGTWAQITKFSDRIVATSFGRDGMLYMLSRKDAPRGKIIALPLEQPALANAKTVVPEGAGSITEFVPTEKFLYVCDIAGGPLDLRVFNLQGEAQPAVPVPPVASVGGLVRLQGDNVLFGSQTYVEPFGWFRYDPSSHVVTKLPLSVKSPISFADIEVIRDSAASKDGTRVPMTILVKKGTKLDGNNPVLLYGYGGYGISETPHFSPIRRLWFNNGGVYVVANIRGGGEYGDEWHANGALTKKQNVFDDFAACAQHLIDGRYTNTKKLAIMGGSNGGLLMGAELTQHPDLFRAVVSYVGLYDMLRVELFPNGAFNVTEFGTVKNPEQFKALYAYSPIHHVKDGTPYPAVMFLTGDNDGRVDPANSRKMTARLQAATTSGLPILLRTSASAGHGIGSSLSQVVEQDTDVYIFLFSILGIRPNP